MSMTISTTIKSYKKHQFSIKNRQKMDKIRRF